MPGCQAARSSSNTPGRQQAMFKRLQMQTMLCQHAIAFLHTWLRQQPPDWSKRIRATTSFLQTAGFKPAAFQSNAPTFLPSAFRPKSLYFSRTPQMHMQHAHAACTCRMHMQNAHAACTHAPAQAFLMLWHCHSMQAQQRQPAAAAAAAATVPAGGADARRKHGCQHNRCIAGGVQLACTQHVLQKTTFHHSCNPCDAVDTLLTPFHA